MTSAARPRYDLVAFRDLGTCTDQRLDFFRHPDTWTTWPARVVRLPAWLYYNKLLSFNIATSRHFPGPTAQRLRCERLLDYWIIIAGKSRDTSKWARIQTPSCGCAERSQNLLKLSLMSATPTGNHLHQKRWVRIHYYRPLYVRIQYCMSYTVLQNVVRHSWDTLESFGHDPRGGGGLWLYFCVLGIDVPPSRVRFSRFLSRKGAVFRPNSLARGVFWSWFIRKFWQALQF